MVEGQGIEGRDGGGEEGIKGGEKGWWRRVEELKY